MGTSQPRLLPLVTLAVAISLVALLPACKGSTTPEPPPPVEKVDILTTVTAKYLFSGGQATGTVAFEGLGTTVTKNLGEQADLGQINKGTTSPFTITINATGALKRIFRQVQLGGTQTLSTDVAESTDLDASNLIQYVLFDGKNRSWTPTTVKAIFNPDTDGTRLPQEYIAQIEQAMINIQNWSKRFGTDAYITGVTFDENGTNIYDDYRNHQQPEGEIWVYKVHDTMGTTNGTHPIGGGSVTSAGIFINTNSASYIQTYGETLDAFIHGEQNINGFSQLPRWFCFMMNRPRDTNNYVLALDNESQDGIDTFSTLQTLTQATVSTTAISTLSAPPTTPILHKPGQAPSAGSFQTAATRPASKERIRN